MSVVKVVYQRKDDNGKSDAGEDGTKAGTILCNYVTLINLLLNHLQQISIHIIIHNFA